MPKLKILICGDSFAASKDPASWTSLLKTKHTVTQHGWGGCGEYKIYQQMKIQDHREFDLVIISHTSATRVYIKNHPLYQYPHEHEHADLIYNDISSKRRDNAIIQTAADYFEQIFDIEYHDFLHGLILDKINKELGPVKSLHLFPLHVPSDIPFEHWVDIRKIPTSNPGKINHCDETGNKKIFNLIEQWIEKNY